MCDFTWIDPKTKENIWYFPSLFIYKISKENTLSSNFSSIFYFQNKIYYINKKLGYKFREEKNISLNITFIIIMKIQTSDPLNWDWILKMGQFNCFLWHCDNLYVIELSSHKEEQMLLFWMKITYTNINYIVIVFYVLCIC